MFKYFENKSNYDQEVFDDSIFLIISKIGISFSNSENDLQEDNTTTGRLIHETYKEKQEEKFLLS
jgi:hypothetical protein